MRHPDETQLALFAGGDLDFLGNIRTKLHLRGCESCRSEVAAFQAGRERLQSECDELPATLDWDRLAAEITGNIRVGLAAGECVADVKPSPVHQFWKPALAGAGMMAVTLAALWLNFPVEQRENLARGVNRIWSNQARVAPVNPIYLESTGAGIQVNENGAALTMMHPDSAPSFISVSTQKSVGAGYVDPDTGQVTINNVYSQ
jgi:hypothetical protein